MLVQKKMTQTKKRPVALFYRFALFIHENKKKDTL